MQSVFIDEELPTIMPDKPIDIIMLQRIDEEQKETASHVKGIDQGLQTLALEVSEIKGSIKPPAEVAWWVKYILAPICVAAIVGIGTTLFHLEMEMSGIESLIRNNGGYIAGLRLKEASQKPEDPRNISEVTNILAEAKKSKLNIDRDTITQVGTRFMQAANANPAALDAVSACAAYRSELNSPPFDLSSIHPPSKGAFSTNFYRVPLSLGQMYHSGSAPAGEAAQFGHLGESFNANIAGPEWVLFKGGSIKIDGYRMKRVVIRDALVIYKGGPVDLRDVYFINCTFDVKYSVTSERLYALLLAGGATNYSEGVAAPS
jgi:hypothetical protein